MEEGTDLVTYCPASVPCVPSHPDVPIIVVTQPCTVMTVVAPKCTTASMALNLEMSKRRRVTKPVTYLLWTTGFVIRYGWKQELISVCQCLRRAAITLSGMLDDKQRLCFSTGNLNHCFLLLSQSFS